jgi:hypothetical protein
LAEEASRTATDFFRMCVRALDYLPPVDVTLGDFLRAVITSQIDYDPEDKEGIRDAWMQAFRYRQILPGDASSFSEEALCWSRFGYQLSREDLPFGGPLGLTYLERKRTAKVLAEVIGDNRQRLGLDPRLVFSVPSFHPVYRADRSGSLRWDLVAEVVQTESAKSKTTYPIRGGTTLILSTHSTSGGYGDRGVFLRYAISKTLVGAEGRARRERQAQFFREQGIKPVKEPHQLRVNFALVHGGS